MAQEAFVKVSRALDGFRDESRLSTWLYRIATNAAMDHLRRRSSRATTDGAGEPETDGSPEGGAADDGAPRLDTLLIKKEMNDCIRGVVNGLPENYRTVLVLSDLEELTNAEISDVLGVSLDTVKIRLHRARTRLRQELDRKCSFYHDDRNELACDRKTAPLKFLKK